jgi:hypothetical protein
MTNNVGMLMRQARPTYMSNGGSFNLGRFANSIMPGGEGSFNPLTGKRAGTGTSAPAVVPPQQPASAASAANQMMSAMPVGQPIPMPQAPVNIRNALGTAIGAASTPMNPRGGTMMNPLGQAGYLATMPINRVMR